MKILKLLTAALLIGLLAGCSSIASKSWAVANSADAFKVTISDPMGNGTPLPQIIAGGGVNTIAFQKPFAAGERASMIVSYSRRKSLWSIFSTNTAAGNVSFIYIGGSDETSQETAKNLEAISKIVNDSSIEKVLEKTPDS